MKETETVTKFSRVLVPAEEGGWCAYVLEWPGCLAEGDTQAEALANLERAAESWHRAAQEAGHLIWPMREKAWDRDWPEQALRHFQAKNRRVAGV